MPSMPASRSARATIFTPRSWPSSPTLAISTRMGAAMAANCTVLPSAHPMATDPNFFRDLAWVIVAAVAGGALAWLARQPLILGYVVGGILVGRFTPGPTVSDTHTFELFAEIGVVLLMFSVGIEFSLRDLLRVRWVALLGGPLGIVLTAALGAGAGGVLGWPPGQGLAVGLVISVASRSEEHTSELQSLAYLVCRLLLEKKKKNRYTVRCPQAQLTELLS